MKVGSIFLPTYANIEIQVFDDMLDVSIRKEQRFGAACEFRTPNGFINCEIPVKVAFNFKDPRGTSPYTIAHECVHIANYVFAAIGAHAEFRNDEEFCYLVEFLMYEFGEIILKQRKVHKNKGRNNGYKSK